MSIKYEPEIRCINEGDDCFIDLCTCPCYRSEYVAFFYKRDGNVFTKEHALEMLHNTSAFNEDQKMLLAVCEYAIKRSNVASAVHI